MERKNFRYVIQRNGSKVSNIKVDDTQKSGVLYAGIAGFFEDGYLGFNKPQLKELHRQISNILREK